MMPLVNYSATPWPVFDINLDADPYERWQEVAAKHSRQSARFLADIEKMTKQHAREWVRSQVPTWYGGYFSTMVGPLLDVFGRVTGKLAATLARCFGEGYQAEIRGFAAAARLPESKLFLANLMYDMTVGSEGLCNACSSFSVTIDGHPVLVRNMDWAKPRSTGRYTVMTRFHRGRHSYLNIAPLGCVGVLSALRPGAWAVTLNQAPGHDKPQMLQWPAMHRLRAACDAATTFPSLVRHICEYQTMTPFFAHVVGTQPAQQVVVEGVAHDFYRRRAKPGEPLIQTNHFVSAKHQHLNWTKQQLAEQTEEIWEATCDRYEALKRRLQRKPQTLTEALAVLRYSPVTHSDTMNQMALRPGDGEAIVRVRS